MPNTRTRASWCLVRQGRSAEHQAVYLMLQRPSGADGTHARATQKNTQIYTRAYSHTPHSLTLAVTHIQFFSSNNLQYLDRPLYTSRSPVQTHRALIARSLTVRSPRVCLITLGRPFAQWLSTRRWHRVRILTMTCWRMVRLVGSGVFYIVVIYV